MTRAHDLSHFGEIHGRMLNAFTKNDPGLMRAIAEEYKEAANQLNDTDRYREILLHNAKRLLENAEIINPSSPNPEIRGG